MSEITSKRERGGWTIFVDGVPISWAATVEGRQAHMQNLAKAEREAEQ